MEPPLDYVPHGNWKCKWYLHCLFLNSFVYGNIFLIYDDDISFVLFSLGVQYVLLVEVMTQASTVLGKGALVNVVLAPL